MMIGEWHFADKWAWEDVSNYTVSRAQARAILGPKRKRTFACECWKRLGEKNKNGCDYKPRPIKRNRDGSFTIGCATLTKEQVQAIKKWAFARAKRRTRC